MTTYFDTGVILKLYTAEPGSQRVAQFVHRRALPLHLSELHLAECTAAFRLKQFRGECTATQATRALALIDSDLRAGVLRLLAVDWTTAWSTCRSVAAQHAARTGCRTLDSLHVACALTLGAKEFVTTNRRQAALAARLRLRVTEPT